MRKSRSMWLCCSMRVAKCALPVERIAVMAQTATGELRKGDRVAVMAFGDEAARPCADLVADFMDDALANSFSYMRAPIGVAQLL